MPFVVKRVEDWRSLLVSFVDEETRRDYHWRGVPRLVLRLSFFRNRSWIRNAEFMSVIETFSFRNPSFEGRFEHMHNIIVEKYNEKQENNSALTYAHNLFFIYSHHNSYSCRNHRF